VTPLWTCPLLAPTHPGCRCSSTFGFPPEISREDLARSLTKASEANDYHILGFSQSTTEERSSLNAIIAKGRPLLVIGTLALAGITLKNIKDPASSKFFVNVDLLRKSLEQSFPLLAVGIARRSISAASASASGASTPVSELPPTAP